MMTVREALDEKRAELLGKVSLLVMCNSEWFYELKEGYSHVSSRLIDQTVYPVNRVLAQEEATFFGVEWIEV